MKRTTKRMLWSALIVFCLGVLLAICGFVWGLCTKADLYGDGERTYDIASFAYSMPELYTAADAVQPSELNELSVDLQAANILLAETDGETKIEFYNADRNNLSFSYRSGIFTIGESEPVNRFGFRIDGSQISFAGIRHLFHFNAAHGTTAVKIYWNPQDTVNSFRLNVTVGSLTAENLSQSADLTMTTFLGKLTASDCKAPGKALIMKSTLGSQYADGCVYDYATCNTTCGNIRLSTGEGKTDASAVVGNLTFTPLIPMENYHLRSNTTVGSVSVDGQGNVGTQYNAPESSGVSDVKLSSTVGKIRIKNFS